MFTMEDETIGASPSVTDMLARVTAKLFGVLFLVRTEPITYEEYMSAHSVVNDADRLLMYLRAQEDKFAAT